MDAFGSPAAQWANDPANQPAQDGATPQHGEDSRHPQDHDPALKKIQLEFLPDTGAAYQMIVMATLYNAHGRALAGGRGSTIPNNEPNAPLTAFEPYKLTDHHIGAVGDFAAPAGPRYPRKYLKPKPHVRPRPSKRASPAQGPEVQRHGESRQQGDASIESAAARNSVRPSSLL